MNAAMRSFRANLATFTSTAPASSGVMFIPDPKAQRPPKPRRWTAVRKKLLTAGCEIYQDCDDEGSALFDPSNREQAKAAIRVAAGAKPRRVLSEAQKANLELAQAASPLFRPRAPERFPAPGTIPEGQVIPE